MLRTLYAKLALALAFLLLVIGVLYSLINLSVTHRYLDTVTQRFNRNLADKLVADRNLVQAGQLDESHLEQMFHDYMEINPNIEIYLLDAQGKILSFSADPGKVIRHRVGLEPIRRFLADEQAELILGDDPRHIERQKVFSVSPIPSAADIQGYLYVVLRGEAFDAIDQVLSDNALLRFSAYAVVISLVAGLLIGLLIFWLLTRRLRRLSEQIQHFQQNDFALDIKPQSELEEDKSGDELSRLQRTFDVMAQRINEQIQELKTIDKDRRDMIANISHDLRTPLASMNGYIETLQLKSNDLNATTRQEYLDIALSYGRRLAKLVDDLFVLAMLEAVGTQIQVEPFPLADLVQDVVQNFKLRAQKSNIKLTAKVQPDTPLVVADIGLIERVLDNLISNAFAHAEHGTDIQVEVEHDSKVVTTRICDNGCGIPSESLESIFKRSKRGENSRTNLAHAGLGLAIVKQILQLHNGDVSVQGKPGTDTVFSFSLPVWRN